MQRNLVGCGLWGGKELDTSKQTGHACLRGPCNPHPPSITTPVNAVFAVLVSCGLPHPPSITAPSMRCVCCARRAVGSVPEEWVTLHWAPTSCCSGQMLSHLSPPHQAPFRNRLPLGLLWVSDAVGAPSRDGTLQRGRWTQRRQEAGPFLRWPLPHRVAAEPLGKSPLLTGLTVRSSTLSPRPPRPSRS